jgi:glycosyltransferase 2 family protein
MRNKSLIYRYSRIVISATLFLVALYFINWHNVLVSFYQSNAAILLFAFSLHLIGLLVSVIRWQILARAVGISTNFKDLFILYWISLFYNIFLPTSIGGDVVRIYDLSKFTGNLNGSISTVVMDRLLGMIVFMFIAVIALFAGAGLMYSQSLILLVIVFFIGFAFLLAVLLSSRIRASFSHFIPMAIKKIIEKKTTQFLETFSLYRHNSKVLILTILWSLLLQLNVIFYFYVIGISLGIHVHFFYYCVAIPVIQVATLLPISISGIGVREVSFIALFNQFNVSSEHAFSLSILGFILAVVFNSIGGLFLLIKGDSHLFLKK